MKIKKIKLLEKRKVIKSAIKRFDEEVSDLLYNDVLTLVEIDKCYEKAKEKVRKEIQVLADKIGVEHTISL